MLHLYKSTIVVALCVGALVYGLIIFAAIKWRGRRQDGLPSQQQYHVPLEVIYTVTPIIIVAVLFVYAFRTENTVDSLSKHPDLVVRVDGFQWQWQFHYVHQGVTVTGFQQPPDLVLPVGETIRFELVSHDVIHSFYVPGWLFKRDVIPGVDNKFQVQTTKTGHYQGRCAEFCGLGHAQMVFDVSVVPKAQYQRWMARQRAASTTTTVPGPAR